MAGSFYTLVPFKWYGSKAMALRYILAVLPPGRVYCEPFGGAAVVLVNKEPHEVEIFNDISEDVVNFFRVLREKPDRLIWRLWATPYARKEFYAALDKLERQDFEDDVDRARAFWVATNQTHAPRMGRTWSVRYLRQDRNAIRPITSMHSRIDALIVVAQRLRTVYIECIDAFKLIPRVDAPDAVFYVDPPWSPDALDATSGHYADFTIADHERLAELLHSLKGKVIHSGRRSPTMDRLYADWLRVDLPPRKKFLSVLSRLQNVYTESMWLNYELPDPVVRRLEAMGARIVPPGNSGGAQGPSPLSLPQSPPPPWQPPLLPLFGQSPSETPGPGE